MGPTRVTAAVPTPSHPLQFQKGPPRKRVQFKAKDRWLRVAEALLQAAESNDGQSNERQR